MRCEVFQLKSNPQVFLLLCCLGEGHPREAGGESLCVHLAASPCGGQDIISPAVSHLSALTLEIVILPGRHVGTLNTNNLFI